MYMCDSILWGLGVVSLEIEPQSTMAILAGGFLHLVENEKVK